MGHYQGVIRQRPGRGQAASNTNLKSGDRTITWAIPVKITRECCVASFLRHAYPGLEHVTWLIRIAAMTRQYPKKLHRRLTRIA